MLKCFAKSWLLCFLKCGCRKECFPCLYHSVFHPTPPTIVFVLVLFLVVILFLKVRYGNLAQCFSRSSSENLSIWFANIFLCTILDVCFFNLLFCWPWKWIFQIVSCEFRTVNIFRGNRWNRVCSVCIWCVVTFLISV